MRLLPLLLLLAACDTKATASDPQIGGGARAEAKSKEYESCGATMHCGENLRCFDNTCRRIARSAIGDYYAAVGAAALQRGETEPAIAAFAQAINQYEADKSAGSAPPDIDCQYGAALAAGKAKKENAELAARVLHRCVLAVPVGSSLRFAAMERLATLEGNGLDPVHLGAGKTADLYLTKAAARPSSDKLSITFSSNPEVKKSWAAIQEKLGAADQRAAFVACWEAHFAATKKDELTVTIGVKSSFYQSEYEDDPARWVVKIEAPTSVEPAEACVRNVVEPVLKATKMVDGFNTKLAVTIK
jgi:hypothetical protein